MCKHGAPWKNHPRVRSRLISPTIPATFGQLLFNEGVVHRDAQSRRVRLHDALIAKVLELSEPHPCFIALPTVIRGKLWLSPKVAPRQWITLFVGAFGEGLQQRRGALRCLANQGDTTDGSCGCTRETPPQEINRLIGLSEIRLLLLLGNKTLFCTFRAHHVNTVATCVSREKVGSRESERHALWARWSRGSFVSGRRIASQSAFVL